MKLKINGKDVKGTKFAYDGCHKIYIIEDLEDEKRYIEYGYKILEIDKLIEAYNNSCELRFISNAKLNVSYLGQPVKCRYCGSENLKDCNEEIGGYNIPEGCLCEYDVCCEECGEVVAHCAYGKWSY